MTNSRSFLSKAQDTIGQRCQLIQTTLNKKSAEENVVEVAHNIEPTLKSLKTLFLLLDCGALLELISEACILNAHIIKGEIEGSYAELDALMSVAIIVPISTSKIIEGSLIGNEDIYGSYVERIRACRGIKVAKCDSTGLIKLPEALPKSYLQDEFVSGPCTQTVGAEFSQVFLGWLANHNDAEIYNELFQMLSSVAAISETPRLAMISALGAYAILENQNGSVDKEAAAYLSKLAVVFRNIGELPEDSASQLVGDSVIKRFVAYLAAKENTTEKTVQLLKMMGVGRSQSSAVMDSTPSTREIAAEIYDQIQLAKTHFNRAVEAEKDSHFKIQYSSYTTKLIQIHSLLMFTDSEELADARPIINKVSEASVAINSKQDITDQVSDKIIARLFKVEELINKSLENKVVKEILSGSGNTAAITAVIDGVIAELFIATKDVSEYIRGNSDKRKAMNGVSKLIDSANNLTFINLKELVPLLCTSSKLIRDKVKECEDDLADDSAFRAAAYGIVACQQYLSSLQEGFYPRSDLVKKALKKLEDHSVTIVGEVQLDVIESLDQEENPLDVFISEAISDEDKLIELKNTYRLCDKEVIYTTLALVQRLRDASHIAELKPITDMCNATLGLVEIHNEFGVGEDVDINTQQQTIRVALGRIERLVDEAAEERSVKTWVKGWIEEIAEHSIIPNMEDVETLPLDAIDEEIETISSAETEDLDPEIETEKPEGSSSEDMSDLDDFIDDDFLEVYRSEVQRFVVELQGELENNAGNVTRNMIRAIHSLKGASGSVEYMSAHKIYDKIEEFLDEVVGNDLQLTDTCIEALTSVANVSVVIAENYPSKRDPEVSDEILSQFELNIGAVSISAEPEPEPEPSTEEEGGCYDQDLLEIVVEDLDSQVPNLRDLTSMWSGDLENKTLAEDIRRDMHSLKGLGNLVGASALGELCHEFETLFDLIISGAITDRNSALELVNVAITVIEDQASLIKQDKPVNQDEKLFNCLKEAVGSNRIDLSLLNKSIVHTPVKENDVKAAEEVQTSKHPEPNSLKVNNKTVEKPSLVQAAKNESEKNINEAPDKPVKAQKKQKPQNQNTNQENSQKQKIVDNQKATKNLDRETIDSNITSAVKQLLRERGRKVKIKGDGLKNAKLKVEPELIDNTIDISNEISGGMHKLEVNSQQCRKQVMDIAEKLHAVDRAVDSLLLDVRNILNSGNHGDGNVEGAEDGLESFGDISDNLVKLSSYTHYLKDDAENILQELDSMRRGIQGQWTLIREVRDELYQARLIRFGSGFAKYKGAVNSAATRLGKDVEVILENDNVLIDRNVLDALSEPIGHILRNAVAHGVESTEERQASGKTEQPKIKVSARRENSNIIIEVNDNGKGIDPVKVKEKALEKGIISHNDDLSESDIYSLITAPGFTTAESVNDVAGRGVGMDVVRNEIEKVGGVLQIESELGCFAKFTLIAPEVVGSSQCMIVKSGNERYALSSNQIKHIEFIPQAEIQAVRDSGWFQFVGEGHQYIHISDMIGIPECKNLMDKGMVPLVMIEVDGQPLAVEVDDALSMVELNIKQLPTSVRHIKSISGYSELVNGEPIYILDMYNLYRGNIDVTGDVLKTKTSKIRSIDRDKKARAMVVDDSSAYRKSTEKFLDRIGYEVMTATNAIDGLDTISKGWMPDVILLDAEMPRMDGFGFAQAVRAKSQTRDIPIIMITSRSGEKFEKKAQSVGIDVFMNKPFKEETLRASLDKLLLMEVAG